MTAKILLFEQPVVLRIDRVTTADDSTILWSGEAHLTLPNDHVIEITETSQPQKTEPTKHS